MAIKFLPSKHVMAMIRALKVAGIEVAKTSFGYEAEITSKGKPVFSAMKLSKGMYSVLYTDGLFMEPGQEGGAA